MSQRIEPVVIRLHLPPLRYGFAAAASAGLGIFAAFLSVQPRLDTSTDLKAQAMRRTLMSVDRIAGVWPLPACMATFLLAVAALVIWALVARRPFELLVDSQGVRWPSFMPWRAPCALAWSEIDTVATNQTRDHLVFNTTRGRRVMPAFWLPSGTSLDDVVRTATALRTQAMGRA